MSPLGDKAPRGSNEPVNAKQNCALTGTATVDDDYASGYRAHRARRPDRALADRSSAPVGAQPAHAQRGAGRPDRGLDGRIRLDEPDPGRRERRHPGRPRPAAGRAKARARRGAGDPVRAPERGAEAGVFDRGQQSLERRQEPRAQKVDDKAAREAALAFEKERKRRDSERRKEETAREKERKRREQAIAKAETALEEAKRDHETKVEEIKRDRAALDRRSQAEDARWEKQKEKLETALRRARD